MLVLAADTFGQVAARQDVQKTPVVINLHIALKKMYNWLTSGAFIWLDILSYGWSIYGCLSETGMDYSVFWFGFDFPWVGILKLEWFQWHFEFNSLVKLPNQLKHVLILKHFLISTDLSLIKERKQPRSSHCCTTGAHHWIIHLIRGLWAQRQVRDRETLDYWGTAGTAMGSLTSSMNSLPLLF